MYNKYVSGLCFGSGRFHVNQTIGGEIELIMQSSLLGGLSVILQINVPSGLSLVLQFLLACTGAYLVALYFATIVWAYRDVTSRTRDVFSIGLGLAIVALIPFF